MRFLARLVCTLVTLSLCTAPLPYRPMTLYVLEAPVVMPLQHAWDTKDAYQTERAYCATYKRTDFAGGTIVYQVKRLFPAITWAATPYSIMAICAMAPMPNVLVHVHPPTTCARQPLGNVTCKFGGEDAFQCDGSPTDKLAVRLRREPFGLVQCRWNGIYAYGGQ